MLALLFSQEYKTEFMLAKKQEKPGLRPFKIRDLKVGEGRETFTCLSARRMSVSWGSIVWSSVSHVSRSLPGRVPSEEVLIRGGRAGWRIGVTRTHCFNAKP